MVTRHRSSSTLKSLVVGSRPSACLSILSRIQVLEVTTMALGNMARFWLVAAGGTFRSHSSSSTHFFSCCVERR